MSHDRPSIEELLARLDTSTSELGGSQLQPERAWELLKERGWITRELAVRGADAPLSGEQLERLGKAIRGGEQVRQSIAVGRETAREQARELRAARRARSAFQPYRKTSGGHVKIDA